MASALAVVLACSSSDPTGLPAPGDDYAPDGGASTDGGAESSTETGPRECRPAPDSIGTAPAALDTEIAAILARHRIPGVTVAVVKGDKTVFIKGYGLASRAGGKQTARTVHLLMSASKPVTAIAIMQLVEAGKLSLDDDVDKLLAGVSLSIRNPKHPTTPITVRALLTHTSTIVDSEAYWDPSYFTKGDPKTTLQEFVTGYFTPGKPNFGGADRFLDVKPGEMSCYTNVGVGLLSLLVEIVAKRPFAEYCKEKIFEVLGMSDTSFLIGDQCDASRIVENLAYQGGSFVLDHYGANGQPESHPEVASGMIRTTAIDMARFVRGLANDGELDGKRILTAASALEIKKRQLSATVPTCDQRTTAGNQGLLAYYSKDAAAEYFGHAGGGRGVGTDVFYRTSDRAGFVVLGNSRYGDWVNDVEIALLQAADGL